jgi:hypothetical protein
MLVQSDLDLSSDSPEQLTDLVDLWLWGFSDPQYWPSASDARSMLTALVARPDANHPSIREAIDNCILYIRSAGPESKVR